MRLAEAGGAYTTSASCSSLSSAGDDQRFAGSPLLVQHLMRQAEATPRSSTAEQVFPPPPPPPPPNPANPAPPTPPAPAPAPTPRPPAGAGGHLGCC